jgi:UDP-sulfoquinovose synthase
MSKTALVLGADGYLGWPTCMRFAAKGWDVVGIDNYAKRAWMNKLGGLTDALATKTHEERAEIWNTQVAAKHEYKSIDARVLDLMDKDQVYSLIEELKPDVIIHYGEQPSAPYSMGSVDACVETQTNNVVGNLNLIWAIREASPKSHLIKLGTMGEYGTPNIDIEEGYLDVEHKGRKHTFLYPKTPGSFYHLSKVHDSANLDFACRMWNLKVTDLNQGVVYGTRTTEMELAEGLGTFLHYDAVFGTALNRFCVQAAVGEDITPYGSGDQVRGTLNIIDTLNCVEIAANKTDFPDNKMDVFNQFTEFFSVNQLAETIKQAAEKMGIPANIKRVPNPRKESEDHYYNPINDKFIKQYNLKPTLLDDEVIAGIISDILSNKEKINKDLLSPKVTWK